MPAKRKTTAPENSDSVGKRIPPLAAHHRAKFPEMSGVTRRNRFSTRAFAESFPAGRNAKQPVSHFPWCQIIRLIAADKATTMGHIQCGQIPHPTAPVTRRHSADEVAELAASRIQSRTLATRATERDTLLPKLLSGESNVAVTSEIP